MTAFSGNKGLIVELCFWLALTDLAVKHSPKSTSKARKHPIIRMKNDPCMSVTVTTAVEPTPPLAPALHSSSGGQKTCIRDCHTG